MLKLINNMIISIIPKFFIKIFANQYVAGISIKNAIAKTMTINKNGLHVTLDILGEHTATKNEAINITNQYCRILEEINHNSLNCNISIKPSHIGTDISNNLFMENLDQIHATATKTNNFIRIDMENSTLI